MSKPRPVQPDHFARPRGYSNGMIATGEVLYVGGQIGWQADQTWATESLVGQFAQALDNVLDIVRAAGGEPDDVADMTIFVTDIGAYRSALKELSAIWRDRFDRHYPAMALVGVTELVEPRAKIEIQAVAHLSTSRARL